MEVNATIYMCECGKNIIILDDMFQNAEVEPDDIQCPVCGGEIVMAMDKIIDIKL